MPCAGRTVGQGVWNGGTAAGLFWRGRAVGVSVWPAVYPAPGRGRSQTPPSPGAPQRARDASGESSHSRGSQAVFLAGPSRPGPSCADGGEAAGPARAAWGPAHPQCRPPTRRPPWGDGRPAGQRSPDGAGHVRSRRDRALASVDALSSLVRGSGAGARHRRSRSSAAAFYASWVSSWPPWAGKHTRMMDNQRLETI